MDFDDIPPLLVDTNNLGKEIPQKAAPTPVTIVTGYLGSGKSTLLKHITEQNHGLRIAVVLNEFGQTTDIEKSLSVRNRNSDGTEVEQWVELDNGCMCCTAKDAGVSAIEKLMERNGRFDHVIIETSGLANPAPIAKMFWLDDALQASVKLDGIVTVVDASTILRSLSEGELANLQIACSDVVVINKCEICPNISEVKKRVADINGSVRLIECSYGQVDPRAILSLNAYSNLMTFEEAHTSEHSHSSHHGLSTVVIEIPHMSEKEGAEFEAKLQQLLWENNINKRDIVIHRTKGRLQIGDKTKILQGVREVYEIVEVPYEPEGISKVVFIGKGLEAAKADLSNYLA